jgi:hypothetical protein
MQQQEEKLLSCWWREFAEVSIGPQLKDRERLEQGAGASTQASPQASPQKVLSSRSVRASPATTPVGKKWKEDSGEGPDNQAAESTGDGSLQMRLGLFLYCF